MTWLKTLLAGVLALVLAGSAGVQARPPTVFAAASLKTALDEIAVLWEQAGHDPVRISYAGSSQLARQIAAGAPADIFISADRDWMDHLADRNLIDAASRIDLLGNRLVLVSAEENAGTIEISPDTDLAGMLGGGRLAVAATEYVPAGRYVRAALTSLGLWGSVSGQLAEAENVRAALAFVVRRAAPFGIVYATDAAVEPEVRVVATFPEGSHPPIIYPMAVLAGAANANADAFAAFLAGAQARAVFERLGFTVLVAP